MAIAKKYYVTMTDKFMSGWGKARGKINKLVISCNSYSEAERVYDKAMRRGEMKYINIVTRKPSYDKNRYIVSWHGRDQGDYQNWFK